MQRLATANDLGHAAQSGSADTCLPDWKNMFGNQVDNVTVLTLFAGRGGTRLDDVVSLLKVE